MAQFPTKTAARQACELLRSNLNRDAGSPRSVGDLVSDCTDEELSQNGRKAHSARGVYTSYIRTWILPAWGTLAMTDVKTVAVEAWLGTLPLANASKAKVRNVMHALFNHAMRYEWAEKGNPITLVRQSAKRLRAHDVLDEPNPGTVVNLEETR